MTKGHVSDTLGDAKALADAGAYPAALAVLDTILAAEPENADAYSARGWVLENLGPDHQDAARVSYGSALTMQPDDLWAKEGLANVMRRTGAVDEANRLYLAVIEQGVARCESEEDLWQLVGWCELKLGRYTAAVRTLREALRRDGRWIAVRFDLALALLCAGDRVRSFLEYSRGVHQAVNGGVDRLRGVVTVALVDLEECLAERPALATTREAVAARNLLASTLSTLQHDTRVG